MSITEKTCGGCCRATPSESIDGMVWCLDNRRSNLRGQFSYRVTSINPSHAPCGHFVARTSPLEFAVKAAPAEASEPAPAPSPEREPEVELAPLDVVDTRPTRRLRRDAPEPSGVPARGDRNSGFPKEFFL